MSTIRLVDEGITEDGTEVVQIEAVLAVLAAEPCVARLNKGTYQILLATIPVTEAEWDANAVAVALRGDSGPTALQMRAVGLDDVLKELASE